MMNHTNHTKNKRDRNRVFHFAPLSCISCLSWLKNQLSPTMNNALPEKLLFKDEVYAIQGAVFEVYREMGCGFLEAVYQECLEKELRRRGISFVAQQELKLSYKGELLEQTYKPDIICFGQIILELKAAKATAPEHQAQMLNYLKATGHRLGLIINFSHHPKAEIERFAR